jgi:chromosome segregation ATPase
MRGREKKDEAWRDNAIEFEAGEVDVKYVIYQEQIRALHEDFNEERADRVRLKEQVDSLKGIIAKLKQQCAQAELRCSALANGRRKNLLSYECDFPDVEKLENGKSDNCDNMKERGVTEDGRTKPER